LEKDEQLGGRVKDVQSPLSSESDWQVAGACPVRFQEYQYEMRCLLNELGVELELSTPATLLTYVRGHSSTNTNDFGASGPLAGIYQGLPDPNPYYCGIQCDFFDYLRGASPVNPLTGENDPAQCQDYPNPRSYCVNSLSVEACDFLIDTGKHKSDMQLPLSPCGFFEYLNSEWNRCCSDFYPRGGHSRVISIMEQRTAAAGVRIFKGEAAECITKSNGKYKIRTDTRYFKANRLIVALPKEGLEFVGGSIGESILSQPEASSVIGVPVFTVTAWWPYQWYADLKNDPFENMQVVSGQHCFGRSEFYGSPYLAQQNVTRAVYCDEIHCVDLWKNIHEAGGDEAVIDELMSQYADIFPGMEIPRPVKINAHHISNGVYFPKNDGNLFTNQDLADWAVNPLQGEDVCVVGEAWFSESAAWARGAVLSSLNCLREHFDDILPDDFDETYECLADPSAGPLSNEYFPDYENYNPFGLPKPSVVQGFSSSSSSSTSTSTSTSESHENKGVFVNFEVSSASIALPILTLLMLCILL